MKNFKRLLSALLVLALLVPMMSIMASAADLENKYDEIEVYIAELDKSSKVYKNYITNLEAERKKADEEINKILADYNQKSKQ